MRELAVPSLSPLPQELVARVTSAPGGASCTRQAPSQTRSSLGGTRLLANQGQAKKKKKKPLMQPREIQSPFGRRGVVVPLLRGWEETLLTENRTTLVLCELLCNYFLG